MKTFEQLFSAMVGRAVEFDPTGDLGGTGLSTEDPVNSTLELIGVVLGLLGVIALVLVIVAGVMWMTSGGSPEKIKKAKRLLVAAVIGLVLVMGSYGIAAYVFETLVTATTNTGSGEIILDDEEL